MNQNKISQKIITFIIITSLLSTAFNFTAAQTAQPATTETIGSPKSFSADKKFTVFVPLLTASNTAVTIAEREDLPLPLRINKLSKVYQYDIKNSTGKNVFEISINYEKSTARLKQIFYYDRNFKSWRPLPSTEKTKERLIVAKTSFLFNQVAIFEYPDIITAGTASWYAHKGGMFAASPDFPIGSRLRIFSLEQNKFVDVTVNDFGPDRQKHPDRVVDMDKAAFKKIASLGKGTVKIRVEPLFVPENNNKFLIVPKRGLPTELDISSKAAIIYDSKNKKVIWSKNATTSMPIASLTKLIAIRVFLDTRPTLNKVINYNKADEEFNYKYAKKWELAKLNIADGDTLTVENLLFSSLVGSANNSIETLVRASGLARNDFIDRMNKLVISWGATGTKFYEPTGLSPQNVSSPYDYAIITDKVLDHPIIEKAAKTDVYKFTTIKNKKKFSIRNTNKLISLGKFKITGSKTGYLNEARYCLMTRAEYGSKQLIVVSLSSPTRNESFDDVENLLYYGFSKVK